MLRLTRDANDAVRNEACEFWISLANQSYGKQVLNPHLACLLPVVLEGMRISDSDVYLQKMNAHGDKMIPDSDEFQEKEGVKEESDEDKTDDLVTHEGNLGKFLCVSHPKFKRSD